MIKHTCASKSCNGRVAHATRVQERFELEAVLDSVTTIRITMITEVSAAARPRNFDHSLLR